MDPVGGGGGGLVTKSGLTLATSWTVTRQSPLTMGLYRQEYWNRLLQEEPLSMKIPMVFWNEEEMLKGGVCKGPENIP